MRIKKLMASVLLAALALTAIAPAASAGNSKSVVDRLSQVSERTGEFSTLLTAASCFPDIVKALDDGSARLTLFAPTNKAFAKSLNPGTLAAAAACDPAVKPIVEGVLLDHVVARRVSNLELRLKARRDGSINTLGGKVDVSGNFFRPRLGTNHDFNDELNVKRDKARVVFNLRAGKSVIRVIDRVIVN